MVTFGRCSVDLARRTVTRDGEPQHLEPQAFDVLGHLLEHRDRVVSKAELLEQVWGDQFVSDSALTTRVKEIRRALGDDGRRQEVIRNSRGRGYRFVADVTEARPGGVDSIAPSGHRRHVPDAPPTPSVGLDAEIERLVELTAERRLLTIVGPGGVGKTRLAHEVGRAVAGRHRLGAPVVELARISEPDAVGPAIRRALGRTESDIGLLEGLGSVDALLILDNCEHVIDAVAAEVPSLLSGGDHLRLLATSREPLHVAGEMRWGLAPLSTVGATAPAMALFVARARDVGVTVDENDPWAGSIVGHLDGMPLALEMAAARLATMGLGDLADELERSVSSLGGGRRAAAGREREGEDRHSTLRAVLAWSESLLTTEQQRVLADVSVFAGPVGAEDLAAAVDVADPVEAVRALAERSLVTVDTTRGPRARYGSLETIRQFGRERLVADGRLDVVRRRHAEWFTEAAEEAARIYDTADQADAVARIAEVFDEFRAAHLWARVHDRSLAIRLSHALFQPAFQELRLDVVEWTSALAETMRSDESGAPRLSAEVAQGLTFLGRIDEAHRWAERALAATDDEHSTRAACAALADIALYRGDLARSEEWARRFDRLVEEAGSRIERAYSRASLALAVAYQGRRAEALALLPARAAVDDPPIARAWLAYGRGETLLDDDPSTALRQLDEAIEMAATVNGVFLSGVAHVSASSLRVRTGHPADAVVPLRNTIERLAERGDLTHLLTTVRNLPPLLTRLERWEDAAEVLGGLSRASISPTYGEEADRLTSAASAARSALTDEAFEAAERRGAGLNLDQLARRSIAMLDDLAPSEGAGR